MIPDLPNHSDSTIVIGLNMEGWKEFNNQPWQSRYKTSLDLYPLLVF